MLMTPVLSRLGQNEQTGDGERRAVREDVEDVLDMQDAENEQQRDPAHHHDVGGDQFPDHAAEDDHDQRENDDDLNDFPGQPSVHPQKAGAVDAASPRVPIASA
ncbi:MAG: hypothetical protein HC826_02690, partial [Rhodospirillales bacterium]|nr:hypothetical protein [Rhodospirillales bacterium]